MMKEYSDRELSAKATSHRCVLYRFNHRTEEDADGETVHVYDTVAIFSGDPDKVPLNFSSLTETTSNSKLQAAMEWALKAPRVTRKITKDDLDQTAAVEGVDSKELKNVFTPEDLLKSLNRR